MDISTWIQSLLANFLFAIQTSLKEPLYLFKESHEEPPKETLKTFKIDARSSSHKFLSIKGLLKIL